MKIAWDISRSRGRNHGSGLLRVAHSLGRALQQEHTGEFHWVHWNPWRQRWLSVDVDSGRIQSETPRMGPGDWWMTPEVFAPFEKFGVQQWIHRATCSKAALFHDMIPIRHPEMTWPHSVRRHPRYLKLLTRFDLIFPVSQHSAHELEAYFQTQHWSLPSLQPIQLAGHNLDCPAPSTIRGALPPLKIFCLGILEPRKNQTVVLDALELAWARGIPVEATFAGRCNPHFGKPILRRIHDLQKAGRPLRYLENLPDQNLAAEYTGAHLTLFPSIAEGAGLPLLESLAHGTPVVASNIPSLLEYGNPGGCRFISPHDSGALLSLFISCLNEPSTLSSWRQEVCKRNLPGWKHTARQMLETLHHSQPSL